MHILHFINIKFFITRGHTNEELILQGQDSISNVNEWMNTGKARPSVHPIRSRDLELPK